MKPFASRLIDQYLQHYAAPIVRNEALHSLNENYHNAVVVPYHNEYAMLVDFLSTFSTLDNASHSLLILVINAKKTDPVYIFEDHHKTLNTLKQLSHEVLSLSAQLTLFQLKLNFDVLTMNFSQQSSSFLPHEGVGKARKIGCDLALLLQYKHKIKSNILYTTDMDVILPQNYLTIIPKTKQACSIFAFTHRPHENTDKLLWMAQCLYEISLRYYVSGLKLAYSPYAYHTLGSLLAFDQLTYVQVRGFPNRLAGEDFYFVNKAHKTSQIKPLQAPFIFIKTRYSQRTPFGTGAGIAQLQKRLPSKDKWADVPVYHPDIFVLLKAFQQTLPQIDDNVAAFKQKFLMACHGNKLAISLDLHDIDDLWQHLGLNALHKHLKHQNLFSSFRKKSHALYCWFDGLKTLQFIHFWEKKGLRKIPLKEALAHDFWQPLSQKLDISSWEHLKESWATYEYS